MASSDSCWIVGLVMMCLVTAFGCFAHSVLLWVILSTPSLRQNPSNSFIISLSLTGLLAASISFPSAIAVYFDYRSETTKCELTSSNSSTNHIPYPSILSWGGCFFFQALHNFSIYNSAWLVSAIAFERNVSIARPFYTASVTKYAFLNISITGCSVLFALIPNVISPDSVCNSLYAHHFSDPAITWLLLVMAYLIPSLVVLVMYLNIYRIAHRVRNATPPTPFPCPLSVNEVPRIWTVNPISHSQTESTSTTNKCNKAIWTLILTTGACITLWSPYFWLHSYYSMKDHHNSLCEDELLCDGVPWYLADGGSTTVTWLMYVSISTNPLLYGLLNQEIRSETKRKLARLCLPRCYTRTEIANHEGNGAGEPENFW